MEGTIAHNSGLYNKTTKPSNFTARCSQFPRRLGTISREPLRADGSFSSYPKEVVEGMGLPSGPRATGLPTMVTCFCSLFMVMTPVKL